MQIQSGQELLHYRLVDEIGESAWAACGEPRIPISIATSRSSYVARRRLIGFDGSGVHESFGISPDGKRILLSTLEQARAIHLVEGLPEI